MKISFMMLMYVSIAWTFTFCTPEPLNVCDIGVDMSVENSFYHADDTIKYRLIVYNNGPSDADSIETRMKIQDACSPFLSVSDTSAYSHPEGIWRIPELLVNDTVYLTVSCIAKRPSVIPAKNIKQIHVLLDKDGVDENEANNFSIIVIGIN